MTRLELDILDASGNVLGEGPITAVTAASITRKLDGPGEVSLRLPAADKRVQDLIALERRVRLWAFEAGEGIAGAGGKTDVVEVAAALIPGGDAHTLAGASEEKGVKFHISPPSSIYQYCTACLFSMQAKRRKYYYSVCLFAPC